MYIKDNFIYLESGADVLTCSYNLKGDMSLTQICPNIETLQFWIGPDDRIYNVDHWDFSNVKYLYNFMMHSQIFYDISFLNKWDLSNVKEISNSFLDLRLVKPISGEIGVLNLSSLELIESSFNGSDKVLISLDNINAPNIKEISSSFMLVDY